MQRAVENEMRVPDVYRDAIEAPAFERGLLLNQAIALLSNEHKGSLLEPIFLQAIKSGATCAGNLGSYGQLLLGQGRVDEGLDVVVQALQKAASAARPNKPLLAELMLYIFAHDRRKSGGALSTIKKLIATGVRTPNWNFEPNIARAQDDGHSEIALLRDLAKVLSHGADVSLLDSHVAWRMA